jgi:hypothetical protein
MGFFHKAKSVRRQSDFIVIPLKGAFLKKERLFKLRALLWNIILLRYSL